VEKLVAKMQKKNELLSADDDAVADAEEPAGEAGGLHEPVHSESARFLVYPESRSSSG
jgi:hypothetical protein